MVTAGGQSQVRALDHTGWREVTFSGEYPIGLVEYRDPESPVTVSLEAFSPFIPLNAEDSGLPATVLRFTVKNTGGQPVEAELAGWLENAVCLQSGESRDILRRNRVVRRPGFSFLECTAENAPADQAAPQRPDILFDDFERERYETGPRPARPSAPARSRKARCPTTRATWACTASGWSTRTPRPPATT